MSDRLTRYARLASVPAGAAALTTGVLPAQMVCADVITIEVDQAITRVSTDWGFVMSSGVASLRLNSMALDIQVSAYYGADAQTTYGIARGLGFAFAVSDDAVDPLGPGDLVGSSDVFASAALMASNAPTSAGQVYDPRGFDRSGIQYLGIRFEDGGLTKYGWVEIDWRAGDALKVVRWAYEDDGSAIEAGVVPAPGAVGLLALAAGAAGVRRKRVD